MYQGTLEPISNRADWFGTLEIVDDETGEVVTDLSGFTVSIAVRNDRQSPEMTAYTGDSHITADGGVIQWRFAASEMGRLCPGTYEVGITLSRDGITVQQLIASLPIVDGVVRR